MIRDPLQTGDSPFTLLGIASPGADETEIQAAFERRVAGAGHQLAKLMPRLLHARDALLGDPVQRAVLALLHYDPRTRLSPSPADPAVLALDRRPATARAWAHQLAQAFPDPDLAHALGLLWYWQGVHDQSVLEARLTDAGPDAPGCDLRGEDDGGLAWEAWRAWQRACAYWVAAIANPDFWGGRPEVAEEDRERVKDRLITARLEAPLARMAERCTLLGATALAGAYLELARAIDTERRTAELLALTGLSVLGRPVCCGPMLLDLYGLRERFYRQVEDGLEEHPGDPRLEGIRLVLSPHAHLTLLLEQGRIDEVVRAIAALPEKERARPEVARLAADALFMAGDEHAANDRFEQAVAAWRRARVINHTSHFEEPESLRDRVAALSVRAAAVLDEDHERLVRILVAAGELAEHPEHAARLADALLQRGLAALERGRGQYRHGERGVGTAVLLRSAVADLERAEALGEDDASACLADARELMVAIGEIPDLGADTRVLIDDANAAIEREDWDAACAFLWGAYALTPEQYKPALGKELAAALNRFALEQLDDAAEELEQAASAGARTAPYQAMLEAQLDLRHAFELDDDNPSMVQTLFAVSHRLREIARRPGLGGGVGDRAQQAAARARDERLARWTEAYRWRLQTVRPSTETRDGPPARGPAKGPSGWWRLWRTSAGVAAVTAVTLSALFRR